MNRTFERVEAVNFVSWRHLVFDFKQGTTLLFGKTGAGKSTIPRAVYWCLYGSVPEDAPVDEIVNDVVNKNTMVKVVMNVTTPKGKIDVYHIIRYRRHVEWKNKVIIIKNGKRFGEKDAKVDIINKWIEKIVGLNAEEFSKTIYYVQRDLLRFPALTDTQQKKTIEDLTELQIVPRAEQITKDRLSKTKSMLLVLNERLSQINSSVESSKNVVKKEEKKIHKEKNIVKAEINEARSRLSDVKAEYEAFNKDYEVEIKTQKKLHKELVNLQAMRSLLTKEIEKIEIRLKKMTKAVPGTTCDRCGSILTIETIQASTNSLVADKKKYEDKIVEFEKQINELKKTIEISEISKLEKGIKESEKKIEKWKSYIKIRKKTFKEIEPKVSSLEETISDLKSKKFRTIRLMKFAKRMKRRLNIWIEGFGRKGIRVLLFPDILRQLALITNSYLEVFNYNNNSIQVEYSIIEGKIRQMYKLSESEKRRSYRSLSGGEKQMVDISTNLALREIAEVSRESLNDCVFLDEPLEGLDEELSKRVPDLLALIRKRSIIVIGHNEHLKPYFDTTVNVIKKNKISSFAS